MCVQCSLQRVHPLANIYYGEHACEICGAAAICCRQVIGMKAVEIKNVHLDRQDVVGPLLFVRVFTIWVAQIDCSG